MIEPAEIKTDSLLREFQSTLRRKPRSALFLLLLSAVLAFLLIRLFAGGRIPSYAGAAPLPASTTASAPQPESAADQSGPHAASALTLTQWAKQSPDKTSRNLFAVSIDDYPLDPSHAQSATDSAKSSSALADQMKERQILIENLRVQAAKLALEGVVQGATPKAWVNGLLVGVGQPIGDTGFRVARIEARRIFVERDGVQIELSMQ